MEHSGTIPRRKWILFIASAFVLLFCRHALGHGQAVDSRIARAASENADQKIGAHIVTVNGYPELQVDGQPFFINAAAFPYYGVPHDLWSSSLDRYRELGINTIELRIPWNWHEPQDGEFDFDGHTAPGRDLQGLLRLIAAKGLELIVRPGPIGRGQWRNDGYPDWLLAKSEFNITFKARLTGAQPSQTSTPDGDLDSAESRLLSDNEFRRSNELWLSAVARQIERYGVGEKDGKQDQARSNPLLCVVMDQPAGLHFNSTPANGGAPTAGWRAAWTAGGSDPSCFASAIRPGNVRHASMPGSFPMAGHWQLGDLAGDPPDGADSAQSAQAPEIEALARFTGFLQVRPHFPAMTLDLSGDDLPAAGSSIANLSEDLLLTSRSFLAEGVRGIDFEPFQEALTPPGYETIHSSSDLERTAVLSLLGDPLPAAEVLQRNADLIQRSSKFLASSHPRTILGLLDLRNSFAYADSSVTRSDFQSMEALDATIQQTQRVAHLADIASDFADPMLQPVESLLRDPLLLAVLPPEVREVPLSDAVQLALLEYVRRGGTLICDPGLPAGKALEKAIPANEMTEVADGISSHEFGSGRVVVWKRDFYSWIKPNQDRHVDAEEPPAAGVIRALKSLLQGQGVSTPVFRSGEEGSAPWLFRELLPDADTGPFGVIRADCHPGQDCAEGLLSVSNWSDRQIQDKLQVLMPTTNVRTATPKDYVELPLDLNARESLMLPLNMPLCSATKADKSCTDRVIAAGGELAAFVRDDKVLELTFFAPSKATIMLHLEAPPRKVELLGNMPDKFVYQPPEFPHEPPPPPIPESERNLGGRVHRTKPVFLYSKFRAARRPIICGPSGCTCRMCRTFWWRPSRLRKPSAATSIRF